jgi:thiamine-phosphate pyrophosphorylase
MKLPRLYAIADAGLLAARSVHLRRFAQDLRAAGVALLQYRNKQGGARQMMRDAAELREVFSGPRTHLIFNDRADLALLARFHGVHLGQDDLTADQARSILGPRAILGVSTHSAEQVRQADATACDYIAFGPIFATATKENPDPATGLAGLVLARKHTRKPLVAIGGITRGNCRAVLDAGADSVAVISDLLPARDRPAATREIAEEFLALLG